MSHFFVSCGACADATLLQAAISRPVGWGGIEIGQKIIFNLLNNLQWHVFVAAHIALMQVLGYEKHRMELWQNKTEMKL